MSRTICRTGVWAFSCLFAAGIAWGQGGAQALSSGEQHDRVAAQEPAADQVQLSAHEPAPADAAEAKTARATHLRVAVQQAIKRLPRRELPTADAVRELVELYQQLKADEALAASERQRLLVAVRTRLVRIHKRLVRELESQAAAARAESRVAAGQREDAQGDHHGPRAPKARPRGKERGGDSAARTKDAAAPPRNGGGSSALDYGQQLVELIQEVVRPDIWDLNGGPAVIRYYSPLKALVVTAPGDVHDDVGAVLDGMR